MKKKMISKKLTLHFKELQKVKQTKPNVRRRDKITKIRAEIIETKNTIEKINETKSSFLKR